MAVSGKRKPYLPASRSSIVYEYLMPATPLAQSSDAPEATSENVTVYIVFHTAPITNQTDIDIFKHHRHSTKLMTWMTIAVNLIVPKRFHVFSPSVVKTP